MSEKKKENPFEKMNENFKKGMKQISEGFATLFGFPSKKTESQSEQNTQAIAQDSTSQPSSLPQNQISQSNSQSNSKSVIRSVPVEQEKHELQKPNLFAMDPKAFEDNWKKFVGSVNQTFEKMRNDLIEQSKKNNEKFKENSQKVNEFFAKRKQEWDEKLAKMKEEMKQKEQERKEAWEARNKKIQEDFNKFITNQQKSMERNMNYWNRMSWKAQFNFILWMIPILVIVFVVLYIFRYFESFLPI